MARDDLTRRRIGIAWSTSSVKMANDVGRDIDLGLLCERLVWHGADLISLQTHDRAAAELHAINTPKYSDFYDVAAVISVCDAIVCIDTAALHLAGALGHPKVFALLPFVCSWRWRNGNPWYPSITLCRQTAPDHWPSALAQVKP
jgi:ADP-heptose:LPS heptosyltransferase